MRGWGQPYAFGALSAIPPCLKAKQESGVKGLRFVYGTHDEILSKAKNEPKATSRGWLLLEGSLKILASAFKKKYPFIDLSEWRNSQDRG